MRGRRRVRVIALRAYLYVLLWLARRPLRITRQQWPIDRGHDRVRRKSLRSMFAIPKTSASGQPCTILHAPSWRVNQVG